MERFVLFMSVPLDKNSYHFYEQDAMIMMEITHRYDRPLFFTLRNELENCDNIGMHGSCIFYCDGYAVPIHIDHDACRGVCNQIDLEANPGDFSFVNLHYGVWFVARKNSHW